MADDKTNKTGEKQGEGAKQNGGFPLLPIAGVIIILIGAVLLWQGGMIPGLNKGQTGSIGNNTTVAANPLDDPSAKILLGYMAKQGSLPNAYSILFSQPQDGGPIQIKLEQNGTARRATLTTALYSDSFTWIGNETVVCEQNGAQDGGCALLNDSSALKQSADQLNAMFSQNASEVQMQVAVNKELVQYGTFAFTSPPQEIRVANRTCENLSYTLNYSQIDGQELADIQQLQPAFSVPDPQAYKSFVLSQCMDDQYGIALYSRLDYQVFNTDGTYSKVAGERDLLSFDPTAPDIALPNASVTSDDLQAAIASDQSELQQVITCRGENTTEAQDTCLRLGAIDFEDVRFCAMTSNDTAHGDCVIKMATQSGHLMPELCDQAGTARSECYANIAYLKDDISYCSLVTDATLKSTCLSAVGNLTAPAPVVNSTNQTAVKNSTAAANSTAATNETSGQ